MENGEERKRGRKDERTISKGTVGGGVQREITEMETQGKDIGKGQVKRGEVKDKAKGVN